MRRAGVDHPHLGVGDGRHRLARRFVGQAQDGDVGGIDGLGAAPRILAVGLGQGQQAQVGAAAQPFVDLQAGGALVAIDEYKRMRHVRAFAEEPARCRRIAGMDAIIAQCQA